MKHELNRDRRVGSGRIFIGGGLCVSGKRELGIVCTPPRAAGVERFSEAAGRGRLWVGC